MQDLSIFISYRRADTSADAGRLYDALRRRFGRQSVFMDVDSLSPGQDWIEAMEAAVAKADVVLVMMGRDWLTAQDDHGRRRFDNEVDPVRLEIQAAIRHAKPTIPVLFDDAMMPTAEQLPESLRPLLRRHAIRVSHATFESDVQPLVRSLRALARPRPAVSDDPRSERSTKRRSRRPSGATEAPPTRRRLLPLLAGGAGLLAAIAFAIAMVQLLPRDNGTAHNGGSSSTGDGTGTPASSLTTSGDCDEASGASAAVPARIVSPRDESALPDTSVTFEWSDASPQVCVMSYALALGTARGANDLEVGYGVVCSATDCPDQIEVVGLPVSGRRVYARLYTEFGLPSAGRTLFSDASYVLPDEPVASETPTPTSVDTPKPSVVGSPTPTPAPTAPMANVPAVLYAPAPGTPFTGEPVTFDFGGAVGDVAWYAIAIGTSEGAADIDFVQTAPCPDCALTLSSDRIPADAGTLYVRLYTQFKSQSPPYDQGPLLYRDSTDNSELFSHVPASLTDTCELDKSVAGPVLAGASCYVRDGDIFVNYWLYPDAASLDAQYQSWVDAVGVQIDEGDCSDASSWPHEYSYIEASSPDGVAAGRLICMFDDDAERSAQLFWKHDRTRIFGSARSSTGDGAQLYEFWATEAVPTD